MADAGGVSSQQPLYEKYSISSQWEFTLKNGQTVKGEVYCTDPVADLVVLQDTDNGIRMVSVSSIDAESREEANGESTIEQQKVEIVHAKKALEEREKRAIRMAQDSLKHLNTKVRRSDGLVSFRLYIDAGRSNIYGELVTEPVCIFLFLLFSFLVWMESKLFR